MLKIIKSNVRKHKASIISIFILVTLGAMLLSIGFTVSQGLNSFFYDKIKELDAPHVSYYIRASNFDEFIKEAIDFKGIEKWQATPVIRRAGVKFTKEKVDVSNNFIFQTEGYFKEFDSPYIIDDSLDRSSDFIILPLFFKTGYSYKSGDSIELQVGEQTHQFKISGFFEDIYYGNPMTGGYRAFVSEERVLMLKQTSSDNVSSHIVEIKMENANMANDMLKHISKTQGKVSPSSDAISFSVDLAQQASTMSISIMSMIIIGFSFIIVIVATIVLSYSINTAVEDGIQEIGILKASGYKNIQILWSIVLQYGIMSAFGALLGIALSIILLPYLGEIEASTVGLICELTPNAVSMLSAFAISLGLVILVSVMSAKKVGKITPIIALRSGIQTHNFKRNLFPLAKSNSDINAGIILKSFAQNLKQNILISIIVIAVSFAAVFSLQVYANMVEDTTAFKYMMGMPLTDVWVTVNTQNPEDTFDEIRQMSEVSRAAKLLQTIISFADRDAVGLYVSDDFSTINKKTIIKGRYPIHSNEIAISSIIAKSINKDIGDVIEFSMFGKTEEYLITGITEQMDVLGYIMDITESGMQRLDPEYKICGFTFDLNKDVNTAEFINKLEIKYAGMDIYITDIMLMLNNQLDSLSMGVKATVTAIIIVMVMVIILILYMLIKMKTLREKINIGILKALGFTSKQIIFQIAISFSFVICIGSIIGGILGGFYTNNIMSLLLGSVGINNTNFTTNPVYIIYLVLGVTALSYVVSSIVASRVKRITPHSLLTE